MYSGSSDDMPIEVTSRLGPVLRSLHDAIANAGGDLLPVAFLFKGARYHTISPEPGSFRNESHKQQFFQAIRKKAAKIDADMGLLAMITHTLELPEKQAEKFERHKKAGFYGSVGDHPKARQCLTVQIETRDHQYWIGRAMLEEKVELQAMAIARVMRLGEFHWNRSAQIGSMLDLVLVTTPRESESQQPRP